MTAAATLAGLLALAVIMALFVLMALSGEPESPRSPRPSESDPLAGSQRLQDYRATASSVATMTRPHARPRKPSAQAFPSHHPRKAQPSNPWAHDEGHMANLLPQDSGSYEASTHVHHHGGHHHHCTVESGHHYVDPAPCYDSGSSYDSSSSCDSGSGGCE
jgi:hypothetical protein